VKVTQFYIRYEQLKALKAISDETGAPVSELIRRAIDKYLETYWERFKDAAGSGESR
jgi:predicted DNA-binding protein